nr:unnamed protein product [Digitaria exilis]
MLLWSATKRRLHSTHRPGIAHRDSTAASAFLAAHQPPSSSQHELPPTPVYASHDRSRRPPSILHYFTPGLHSSPAKEQKLMHVAMHALEAQARRDPVRREFQDRVKASCLLWFRRSPPQGTRATECDDAKRPPEDDTNTRSRAQTARSTSAPCHCPGEACGFAGSTAALRDHVASAHGWPVEVEPSLHSPFSVRLRDGFNFVVSVDGDHFLLNVSRHRFIHTVSAVCIRRPTVPGSEKGAFVLETSYDASFHKQATSFEVADSDLADGCPPILFLPYRNDMDMEVTVTIFYVPICMEDDGP